MAREKHPEPRYSRVDIEDVETLRDCSIVIWCNFPIKELQRLDLDNVDNIVAFLLRIGKSWSGFDLPFNKEGIAELNFEELRAIVQQAMRHVTVPQMRNPVTT